MENSYNIYEVVHGGWALIRQQIKQIFKQCKPTEYSILLAFLDTYIPLSLTIYSVVFKTNRFEQFKIAMCGIWLMFLCFRRRHYNKSPLIWLSNILYWKENNKPLYETLEKNINVTDEYPVEHTLSIIRGNTNTWNSPEQLQFKAKSIFASKDSQHNFRSYFTPPKSYTFSRKQLKSLKFQCAKLLVDKVFTPLASSSSMSHVILNK